MIFLPRGLVGLVDDIFHWQPRSRWEPAKDRLDFRAFQRARNPRKAKFGQWSRQSG